MHATLSHRHGLHTYLYGLHTLFTGQRERGGRDIKREREGERGRERERERQREKGMTCASAPFCYLVNKKKVIEIVKTPELSIIH